MVEATVKTGCLFVGGQLKCKEFIRGHSGWYVYILRRPDGQPFYVGKGKAHRAFDHENEARHPNDWRSNPFKLNVIREIKKTGGSLTYEIDTLVASEYDAIAREMRLISAFKRLHEGGPLTNLDPGGGATPGTAPISRERHAATLAGEPENNPERRALNTFVLNIGVMKSVIFKPIRQFIARPTQRFPSATRGPTLRQAVALVASAAANGVSMDAACEIPRKVNIDGVQGLVENGVACDILTSGMADVIPAQDPAEECFRLTAAQAHLALGYVGFKKGVDLGVIAAIPVSIRSR